MSFWKNNGENWIAQLRTIMIKYRNIGHIWELNNDIQEELLWYYYDANKLLIDCINNGCKVTSAVRKEIEENLLLPIAEIEKRKQEQAK